MTARTALGYRRHDRGRDNKNFFDGHLFKDMY